MIQPSSFSTPAVYVDDFSRLAGVLQNLQTILGEATLGDVAQFINAVERELGTETQLEQAIQTCVVRHLVAQRLARRQEVLLTTTKEMCV